MANNVYFLPGLMCDQRLWQWLEPHLSRQMTVQHIHYPQADTIGQFRTAIAEQLPDQPVDIVGFSMGAYLALDFALKQPHRIKRLTIIAASAQGLTPQERQQRSKTIGYLQAHQYTGIGKARLAEFLHPDNLKGPAADVIRAMDKDLGKTTLINQLTATSNRPSLMAELAQLTLPVQLIAAAQDLIAPVATFQQMAEHLSNVKLTIIDPCGHMIPLEAPALLADQLNDFLVG